MHELSCIKDEDNTPTVEYLLTLYNNLPYIIVSVTKENTIVNCTPNVEKLLNLKYNDVKKQNINEFVIKHNLKCQVLNENNNETILLLNNT
jgi:hypothetical protein